MDDSIFKRGDVVLVKHHLNETERAGFVLAVDVKHTSEDTQLNPRWTWAQVLVGSKKEYVVIKRISKEATMRPVQRMVHLD